MSDLQVDLTVAVRVVVRRADDDLIPDCRWGSSRYCLKGIASKTMFPKVAASETVAARAFAPRSSTRPVSESGPRESLMATSWPASANRRAAALPMSPDLIMPIFIVSLLQKPATKQSNFALRRECHRIVLDTQCGTR